MTLSLLRLTRAPGAMAAAKAMVPQARTERTVETRIMTKRLEGGAGEAVR